MKNFKVAKFTILNFPSPGCGQFRARLACFYSEFSERTEKCEKLESLANSSAWKKPDLSLLVCWTPFFALSPGFGKTVTTVTRGKFGKVGKVGKFGKMVTRGKFGKTVKFGKFGKVGKVGKTVKFGKFGPHFISLIYKTTRPKFSTFFTIYSEKN